MRSESFQLLFLLLHALLPGLFREQRDNVPIVGVLANKAASRIVYENKDNE